MKSRLTVLLALGMLAGCATNEPITPSGQAAARAAEVDWSAAAPVEVDLSDYAFSPASLVLHEEQPYRLHLVNRSGAEHTFTAPEFFRSVSLRSDAAGQQALGAGGKVVLGGGRSEDLYVVPLQKGRFDVRCSEPFHAVFGMKGDIVVQ